jgi:hypothetical protein
MLLVSILTLFVGDGIGGSPATIERENKATTAA